ncbi:hypothetical protein C8R43DRAFT_855276, partial [Mycena crocata]
TTPSIAAATPAPVVHVPTPAAAPTPPLAARTPAPTPAPTVHVAWNAPILGASPPTHVIVTPITPTVPTSVAPACPRGAPEWFSNALNEMTKVDLGAHFHALLTAWTRIEAACKFEELRETLTSTGRPIQVTRWINSARGERKARGLEVTKPDEYAVIWWEWYNLMQPGWRTTESDGKTWQTGGEYGTDWDTLCFWGRNGVLSIVAGLYFWGCGVATLPEKRDAWEAAVNDVAWLFEGLAAFH